MDLHFFQVVITLVETFMSEQSTTIVMALNGESKQVLGHVRVNKLNRSMHWSCHVDLVHQRCSHLFLLYYKSSGVQCRLTCLKSWYALD